MDYNYIFFDCESNSGRSHADILTISALFVDKNFKLIEEFNCAARLRKSRIYEIDSFLVNGMDPFEVDKHPFSNFDLTKKTNDKFVSWINKGPVLFCAHNGYQFDYMLTSTHLFTNLFTWPWIFSTGNAKQIDSLPILQNFDFYAPNTIAVELNEKSNKTFKLGSLCRMNGFDLGDKAHTAEADTLGMSKLMELISKKNPELFKKSISLNDKKNVLSSIKEVDYFCHPETFFGRTRQFTSSYLCEHPVYKGYHLVFDLKHDPEAMFSEKSNEVLKKVLNGAPKKYRTIKANKNPFIQDKSYATNYGDEYVTLGHEILEQRANFIIENRDELANRVSLIISDQFESQDMDQTELLPEQMMFTLNPSPADKSLMNHFVMANSMDEQKKIHENFKGPIKHLSEMILLDRFGDEPFTKTEYSRIRKGISRRLLSTNKEAFPTIPDGMARIDKLRVEKKDDPEQLKIIENINKHLEMTASEHEKYLK
jgi:exonuclease I